MLLTLDASSNPEALQERPGLWDLPHLFVLLVPSAPYIWEFIHRSS